MKTVVSEAAADREASEGDCRAVNEALEIAKEREAWRRFGMLSFEDYASWILSNQPAIRRS
jgi:hypothetical protein